MGGLGKGRVGGCRIAAVHFEPEVSLVFVPDLRRAVLDRFAGGSDRRERFVIDHDQFGGVLCLVGGIGDNEGDAITDAADPVGNKDRVGRGR